MTSGWSTENELWHYLIDQGYSALRAPSSGGGTKENSPDLVAINTEEVFAIELKKRSDGTCNFTKDEIKGLEEWASRCNATPLVIVKPDLRKFDSWLVMETSELHEIDSGNYSIRKQDFGLCRSLSDVF